MTADEAIVKFNEMLHDGKHSREECYSFLDKKKYELEKEFYEKNGFRYDMSYDFLYPEMIEPFKPEAN